MNQAGQHLACLLPAKMIQEFKGLVGIVHHVAAIQVQVIGGGGKNHVCYGLLG